MDKTRQSIAKTYFRFRFSHKKPRDIQLSQWIDEDVKTGRLNVSEVIKDLLYAWYVQRHNGGGLLPSSSLPPAYDLPMEAVEGREDPDDPLVRNMMNPGFDGI